VNSSVASTRMQRFMASASSFYAYRGSLTPILTHLLGNRSQSSRKGTLIVFSDQKAKKKDAAEPSSFCHKQP
jgi:hypothetical protein